MFLSCFAQFGYHPPNMLTMSHFSHCYSLCYTCIYIWYLYIVYYNSFAWMLHVNISVGSTNSISPDVVIRAGMKAWSIPEGGKGDCAHSRWTATGYYNIASHRRESRGNAGGCPATFDCWRREQGGKAQGWAALPKTAHNQQLTAIIALMVLCICMCVSLSWSVYACMCVYFISEFMQMFVSKTFMQMFFDSWCHWHTECQDTFYAHLEARKCSRVDKITCYFLSQYYKLFNK